MRRFVCFGVPLAYQLFYMTMLAVPAISDDVILHEAAATGVIQESESPLSATQPADLSDPGFDRFVDMSLLGEAWESLDASLMLDSALQLAEGQRVLMRPHKVITADELMAVIIKVAAEKKDKATLDRLAKAVANRPNAALKAQVEAAQKLSDVSRAGDAPLMVPVNDTPPDQFLLYQRILQEVQTARIRGDQALVEKLEEIIRSCDSLPPQNRDYLLKVTSESRGANQKLTVPAENGSVIATLDMLAAVTRSANEVSDGVFDPYGAVSKDTDKESSDALEKQLGTIRRVSKEQVADQEHVMNSARSSIPEKPESTFDTLRKLGAVSRGTNRFVVINRSRDPVFIAVCYPVVPTAYVSAGEYDMGGWDSPYWLSKGWWRIAPGDTASLYEGSAMRIKVRLVNSKGAIVPDRYYGECIVPFRHVPYEVKMYDNSYPPGYLTGGFFELNANTTFTVR